MTKGYLRLGGPGLLLWLFLVLAVSAPDLAWGAKKKKGPPAQVPEGQLGSLKNPVKCDQDMGQYEYLHRLRGPDGKRVKYKYLKAVDGGPRGTTLDMYLVESKDGQVRVEVFMSRHYQGYIEKRPIEGFTIK